MAKRTDQELDDHIKALFGIKRWSPLLAQTLLARNESYDPPDDADMVASATRLVSGGHMTLVLDVENDMQSVYVTTTPLPDPDPEE